MSNFDSPVNLRQEKSLHLDKRKYYKTNSDKFNVLMTKLNIQGILQNMGQTNNYDPIIEALVNSIDAIKEKSVSVGKINIVLIRQKGVTEKGGNFISFKIRDNGIGLNNKNLDSFDTVYSNHKYERGGKGFGRFAYINYFKNVNVSSRFTDNDENKEISFNFGLNEIIENKTIKDIKDDDFETWTEIELKNYKSITNFYPMEIKTFSKIILEKILIYFICYSNLPKITLEDKTEQIVLNEYYKNSEEIILDFENSFKLKHGKHEEMFEIKVFKIFSSGNRKSTVILTADNREVLSTRISDYISEFSEDFFEKKQGKTKETIERNFILRAYVLGNYLNDSVELERNKFKFDKKEKTLNYDFSQSDIENKVCEILKNKYSDLLKNRTEKKIERIKKYLEENAPYYKFYLDKIDLDILPMCPKDDDIDKEFNRVKFIQEQETKKKSKDILDNFKSSTKKKIKAIFSTLNDNQKSELAHYISLRKVYINILKKALEKNEDGKYEKEEFLHEIIFPMKEDSESISFENPNLWLLDENLNFTEYISSDNNSIEDSQDRINLLFVHKNITFRESNEESKPITIFEFKRPMRDTFEEDSPIEQIVKYVKKLRQNNVKTKNGRLIKTGGNTPFYAYIVGDYNQKIKEFLFSKDFKQLPQEEKWTSYNSNMNLFIEYISWEQLLKDAEERNNVFFKKLGI